MTAIYIRSLEAWRDRPGGLRSIFCMLDKNDVQLLRQMFTENNKVLKHEIRDEMHSVIRSEVFASETRMMKAMKEMKEKIIDGITDVLDNSVLPRLDEHDRDIRSIKRHLKLA